LGKLSRAALGVVQSQVSNAIQSNTVALVKNEAFIAGKASSSIRCLAKAGRAELASTVRKRVT
jgi:hypothetical protein